MKPSTATVMLDQERLIAYDFEALYWLGQLEKKDRPIIKDLGTKDEAELANTLCKFIWACLRDHPFEKPSDLLPYLRGNREESLEKILKAFADVIGGAIDQKKSKNTGGKPGVLPESSSG